MTGWLYQGAARGPGARAPDPVSVLRTIEKIKSLISQTTTVRRRQTRTGADKRSRGEIFITLKHRTYPVIQSRLVHSMSEINVWAVMAQNVEIPCQDDKKQEALQYFPP